MQTGSSVVGEPGDKRDIQLIVNRVRMDMVRRGDMMSVDDVMDILAIPLMGTIPDDEAIVISTNQGGTSGRYEYAIRTKHIWTSAGGSWERRSPMYAPRQNRTFCTAFRTFKACIGGQP